MSEQYSEDTQLEALFGPAAPYSEHKRGETIRFREGGQVKQGEIIWVKQPGQAVQGGQEHGIVYIVDCDEGFPSMVRPGEVLA